MNLQQTVGNQTVGRLLHAGLIQPKLTIGQPNDKYEQEADRVADAVMQMADPNGVGAQEFKDRGELLQKKGTSPPASATPPALEARIQAARVGGHPLSTAMRAFFEPRFGYDFSGVRVHTDARAARAAQEIQAQAFTMNQNIVFGQGQYAWNTNRGRRLLAHELTHVIQQESNRIEPRIQRTYRLTELLQSQHSARRSNPVATSPNVYFYPGSSRNTANRRALVIAGIHGNEMSAWQMGAHVNQQLVASVHPDFHTIVIPRANPTSGRGAGSRRAGTRVADLNREFGASYTSPNPHAQRITTIVNEFDPERILSIHAIQSTSLAGIFLDPIHTGTYPPVGTAAERQRAFVGDPRNLAAMQLTESMIQQVRGAGRGRGRYTRGNVPGAKTVRSTRERFPASAYPTPPGGDSPFSLIYPQQAQVGSSLGTWASGLGKTVVTIEIPGQQARPRIWRAFLPAVWRFLQIPAASSSAAAGSGSGTP
ncbi:DUF4157 domain-containing protein [Chloroflexi bacterium TSY]|nr:DUF4157 domain-containing protein [Chloroflexi bacterium TSY]